MEFMAAIMAFFALPIVFWAILVFFFFCIAVSLDPSKEGDNWFTLLFCGAIVGFLVYDRTGEVIKSLTIASLIIYAVGYLAAGVVWSTVKWYFFNLKIRDNMLEGFQFFENKYGRAFPIPAKNETGDTVEVEIANGYGKNKTLSFVEANESIGAIMRSHVRQYQQSIKDTDFTNRRSVVTAFTPIAGSHTSTIAQWIIFWPISAIWTLINDPLYRLGTFLATRIRGVFQRISNAMFSDI